MHEAWVICGNDREFMISWPTLMLLWQTILMIPTSIVIVSMVFQSIRRTKLNLDTADALMRASLNGFGVDF